MKRKQFCPHCLPLLVPNKKMENVICHEGQVIGDQLGQQVRSTKGELLLRIESKDLLSIDVMPSVYHQVGDAYLIHGQTSQVLDSINKRLSEEDKSLRTYRRALAFSQVRQ